MKIMKKCTCCKEKKPLVDFPFNKENKDGRGSYCRKCKVAKQKIWRGTESGKLWHRINYKKNGRKFYEKDRIRNRIREKSEKRKAWKKMWAKSEKGKASIDRKRKSPFGVKRENCYRITHKAIRRGELKRLPCEKCGEKAQAHHPDYNKPLDVMWLCAEHHREWHKNNKAIH